MDATLAAAQEQRPVAVVLGVDTHQLTHHAALIDSQGRRLADREFEVTRAGYADLLAWANAYSSGQIDVAGALSALALSEENSTNVDAVFANGYFF